MNIYIEYVVMTTRDNCWDAGYWTSHSDKAAAKTCAKEVGGSVWKKTTTDGKSTMKELT